MCEGVDVVDVVDVVDWVWRKMSLELTVGGRFEVDRDGV